jgi:hypothetical protein
MTTLLLRIASAVALLQALAHTLLIVVAVPKHGPQEIAVVEAMKGHRFDFMGSARSYWDFYFGYALLTAFTCVIEGVLFWQLARLAAAYGSVTRPIVGLFVLGNLGYAMLCWRYFFITPIVPDLAIALCLAFAFFAAAP